MNNQIYVGSLKQTWE